MKNGLGRDAEITGGLSERREGKSTVTLDASFPGLCVVCVPLSFKLVRIILLLLLSTITLIWEKQVGPAVKNLIPVGTASRLI